MCLGHRGEQLGQQVLRQPRKNAVIECHTWEKLSARRTAENAVAPSVAGLLRTDAMSSRGRLVDDEYGLPRLLEQVSLTLSRPTPISSCAPCHLRMQQEKQSVD